MLIPQITFSLSAFSDISCICHTVIGGFLQLRRECLCSPLGHSLIRFFVCFGVLSLYWFRLCYRLPEKPRLRNDLVCVSSGTINYAHLFTLPLFYDNDIALWRLYKDGSEHSTSAAYAAVRCLSVCMSGWVSFAFVYKHILKLFHPLVVATPLKFFCTKPYGNIPTYVQVFWQLFVRCLFREVSKISLAIVGDAEMKSGRYVGLIGTKMQAQFQDGCDTNT